MKSLRALLFILSALLLTKTADAQKVLATSINYGNGNVVVESSGNGAPTSSCLGLARYVQLNATAGQNIWQCVSGVMVQQVPSTSGATFNGGTVANPIVLPGPPTAPLQAADKAYVDSGDASTASAASTALTVEYKRATTAEANEATTARAAESNDLTAAQNAQNTANQALALAQGISPTNPGCTINCGGTTVAQVNEMDNFTAAYNVVPTRPTLGTTGTAPSLKNSTPCLTGWTSGSSGGYSGGGHWYCTKDAMNNAHTAGAPDSYSFVGITQLGTGASPDTCPSDNSGSNGICPVSNTTSGGNDSPATMTTDFGQNTYDSVCTNDPLHNIGTGISGLNPPPCGTNVTAYLDETSDSSHPTPSVLWPKDWASTQADNSDHWYRDAYFMIDDVTSSKRWEFDDNLSTSDGAYYGPGMSWNHLRNQFMFMPQSGNYVGHGSGSSTCADSWCALSLTLQSGSTAMANGDGTLCQGQTCILQSGHWYHFRRFEHRTSATLNETETINKVTTTAPRQLYYYDELDLADCGTALPTSGAGCQSAWSKYTLADPANNNLPPEGYEEQYGWKIGPDTQWQMYNSAVSQYADVHIVNDVIQLYQIISGSTTTNYKSAPANLGDFEFDTTLTTNSDADASTMSCTSGASVDATWYVSTPNSIDFNAVGDQCTVTLPASESTLSTRFYISTNTFSTSSTGASVIQKWLNGTALAMEIYANDGANNLTLYIPTTTTSAALACPLTLSTDAQATVTNGKDYVDVTWKAGTSTSTGQVTALVDGVAPTSTVCSWLGTSINTTGFSSGTITGINSVQLGYLTDTGTNATWDFDVDMFGLSNLSTPLGAAIAVTTTQ